MSSALWILIGTAFSVGFIHTVLGPDHYLPFIAMAKARRWKAGKTAVITFLCGLGHVLGSIVLGLLGVFLGIVVFKLESVEALRGDLAGWFLIAFGFVYFAWGMRHGLLHKSHHHAHGYDQDGDGAASATPWVLFTIFVLGPCEPLIPLIMYPAAELNLLAVVAVALVFGATTIATMMACVMASVWGLSFVRLPHLERYAHALAGLTVLLCGGAIKFLGL